MSMQLVNFVGKRNLHHQYKNKYIGISFFGKKKIARNLICHSIEKKIESILQHFPLKLQGLEQKQFQTLPQR